MLKKPSVAVSVSSRGKPGGPVKSKINDFPIVAIGASAGGLEAVSSLLRNVPANTGMAFIYVQHLSREHRSLLTSILSKVTKMKVQEIDNMELMKPDNVYVIPHDKEIEVMNGHIRLLPRAEEGPVVSIDILFSSLALTHKKNVIGIILSGNGLDGTKGLKAIKDAGGITFAQDGSAMSGSMPESAIASGVVDFVLSPPKIAAELVRLSRSDFSGSAKGNRNMNYATDESDPHLKAILEILRKKVHVDFSRYKMATIKRRVNHRMQQSGVHTTKEYIKLLNRGKGETEILYKDLLINVTSFFRDEAVFKHLEKNFLPKLLRERSSNGGLRIWVPACSTGEEAYSIAMLIAELQAKKNKKIPVQIFATDLSDQAIAEARTGKYAESDLRSVSKQRQERFFTRIGDKYLVVKELRQMCVFAPHNILHDPPFSHIDFISCRNLLIYFDAVAQRKALSTLYFALNEGGYLMLGKSETTGAASQLFAQVDSKFKIYTRKRGTGARILPELSPRFPATSASGKRIKHDTPRKASVSAMLDAVIDATLLANYMPACAIINKSMEILKFRGSTDLYLSHRQGNASLNILKMVRPEFSFELRNAIQSVLKTKTPVHRSGIEIKSEIAGLSTRMMALDVSPLKIEWDEPLLLVVFTEQQLLEKYIDEKGKGGMLRESKKLKRQTAELNQTRADMHAVIEAQEKAYEELQAANEEIVSASEEFQTLNEELETSKEEIEATNEELTTTNQELQIRNEQLAEAYDFSEAISATMHEPMLVIDKNLRIRLANKAFYKFFMVMQADTEGKVLYELGNSQWDIPRLRELLDNIAKKNTSFHEYEVTHVFPNIGKKTMLLNASCILQKSQNEMLILITFVDATERTRKRKAEKRGLESIITERTDALEESYKTLEEKNLFLEKMNKELETFTFISSHDLQEPLRKISNFSTRLIEEEKKTLSKSGKYYLERMNETVKRMQMLIQDLLAYARVKGSESKFEKSDLSELAAEVLVDFKETIREKKGEIRIEGLCTAPVIRFQFKQLLHNLISNSLKFSHPKRFPRIVLKSNIVKGKVLDLPGIAPDKNYCHLSVADNGIGFDSKYRDRIFDVFQRLHEYDTYKGTGIGLAICKRVVDNHKGVITATGKLNKGAQFDIYIPV